MRVIVIGSGLSGLTSGALLAKKGHSVKILEQNAIIGGVTSAIEKDGYRWDLGQMLIPELSEGEAGWKILAELGVENMVETEKSYREAFFPDFHIKRPKEYQGRHWRREFLKEIFPEDSKGLDDYFELCEEVMDLFSLNSQEGLKAKVKLALKFIALRKMKPMTCQELMDYYFSNKKLHMVFTGILADYVTYPKDFPGLIVPSINAENQYDERVPLDYDGHEHRQSWTFIKGGTRSLVNALAEGVKKFGGEIQTSTSVTRIKISNEKVVGVVTADGKEYPADIVVASGGAKELYRNLIGEEFIPKKFDSKYLQNMATTESIFMVHLGVDYDPSIHQNGSALTYYYFTYDINKSVKECIEGQFHEGKDGLLIYIPSKHSPDMAPVGHHAVTVYTIAPNYPINGSWEKDKDRWAEKLLDLAEKYVPGLRAHEKTRLVMTPVDFRKLTHLDKHAFGGFVPDMTRPPPPHKTPISGLWFVGAQSENFGGVVGAMTGAKDTVKMVLKKSK